MLKNGVNYAAQDVVNGYDVELSAKHGVDSLANGSVKVNRVSDDVGAVYCGKGNGSIFVSFGVKGEVADLVNLRHGVVPPVVS